MQVSVEAGEGLERRMTVEVPAEQVDKEVEKRLKNIARTARMDGFRPGKVPMSIVRRRYGGEVRQEVFGELVQSTFYDAAAKEALKPAGLPRIEPLEEEDAGGAFRYTAVFEVMPEITLASLDDVVIKKPVAEVTDSDVDDMLERLRKQRATWKEVDRPAREGDEVTIGFKGTVEGEPFEGGEAEDYSTVLGSGAMIEGFEDGLVGASAGETRTLELTFPEDYPVEDLAGKPVVFEVTVNKVSEQVLPEVDDTFAESFGVAEGGVEKLRDDVRNNMERELADRIKGRIKSQVMDALLAAHPIDVPAALIDEEVESLRKQTRQRLGGNANFELPREMFEEEAKRRVTLGLVIAEVVKAGNIELDADRVRKMVEDFAASYEDPEEVVNYYYGSRDRLAGVESVVLEDQAVDWVLDHVKVEEEPSDFSSLTGQSE